MLPHPALDNLTPNCVDGAVGEATTAVLSTICRRGAELVRSCAQVAPFTKARYLVHNTPILFCGRLVYVVHSVSPSFVRDYIYVIWPKWSLPFSFLMVNLCKLSLCSSP